MSATVPEGLWRVRCRVVPYTGDVSGRDSSWCLDDAGDGRAQGKPSDLSTCSSREPQVQNIVRCFDDMMHRSDDGHAVRVFDFNTRMKQWKKHLQEAPADSTRQRSRQVSFGIHCWTPTNLALRVASRSNVTRIQDGVRCPRLVRHASWLCSRFWVRASGHVCFAHTWSWSLVPEAATTSDSVTIFDCKR